MQPTKYDHPCPVFKMEVQHVVMFVFTEPGAVFLWVCMTVTCRWVGRVQIEKGGCLVACSADRCGVGSVCVHGVAGDRSGTGGCCWIKTSHTRLFRDVRLHI